MTAIHRAIDDYLTALATLAKAARTLEVYGARLRCFVHLARRCPRIPTRGHQEASKRLCH